VRVRREPLYAIPVGTRQTERCALAASVVYWTVTLSAPTMESRNNVRIWFWNGSFWLALMVLYPVGASLAACALLLGQGQRMHLLADMLTLLLRRALRAGLQAAALPLELLLVPCRSWTARSWN